mgnify:CR=1 FL=1
MNESLETELKSLSISELNDLYDFLKDKKKKIFSTMRYDKTLFIESNIESITSLKRWISNLQHKNKDKLKDYINEFMLILNYVEALKTKKIEEFIISEDTDLLNELNSKYDTYYSIIRLMGSKEDYVDRICLSEYLYNIKINKDVNDNLNSIINNLKKRKIKIELKDFDFILCVYNYIQEFFKHSYEDDKKEMDNILQEYFESTPSFHLCLYVTLLYILNRKKNEILKYLDTNIKNKLDNVQSNTIDIFNKCIKVRKEYINILGNDNKTLIDYFMNNKKALPLYEVNNKKIKSMISSISNYNIYKNYTLQDRIFYNNNLIEYKFVNDYKYLFNYAENIRMQKFNIREYNNIIKTINVYYKRIIRANKKLKSLNKQMNKVLVMESDRFYAIQNNIKSVNGYIDDLVDNLIEAFDKYDNLKILKNMHEDIDDKSTIHDVLKVLNNNYNVLVSLANEDTEKVLDMEYFHHLSLLDNIYFNHIDSIKYLIEQKYNLYNIFISIPDLNSKEYLELKETLSILIRYLTLLNKNISTEDIKIILKSKKD